MAMSLHVKMMMMVAVVVLAMTVASPANAITCQDGIRALLPCESYLVGSGPPQPSAPCCISAQNLSKMADTTQARRTLCQCFKDAAGSFGVDFGRAKQLPALCHITLSIAISPDVDCTKIP